VRYASGMTCFDVIFGSNLPGVSYVSSGASDPGTMYPTDNTAPNVIQQMRLCGPQAATGALTLGQPYTFTTTYSVPNPYGQPFRFVPEIGINGQSAVSLASVNDNKVTILDSTLSGGKGPAFRQGNSTFTVGSVNTWAVNQAVAADVSYSGTNHVPSASQNVQITPTSTGATATWGPPVSSGTGGQLSGYQLRIYTKASNGRQVASFQTPGTSFEILPGAPLRSGTQYWLEVTAMNPYGTSSPSTPRLPFTLP
jgi:Fibronectin type III domain